MTEPNMEWEDELINDFNALIKEYAEEWYPHLIDTDDNAGERFRDKITEAISQAETRAYEKGKAEEREAIETAFREVRPEDDNFEIEDDLGRGYNAALSDYDENVKSFLGK